MQRLVPLSEGLRPDLCDVGFLFVRLEAFSHFHSSAENKELLIQRELQELTSAHSQRAAALP